MIKKVRQTLIVFCFSCCVMTSSYADEIDGVLSWRIGVNESPLQQSSPFLPLLFKYLAATPEERSNALIYLNQQRTASGMISYSANTFLDQSTQNHVAYLVLHDLFDHYEDEGTYSEGFTGATPTDRGEYTGYKSSVSENISGGNDSVEESIDSLFAAIYHRFGFLSFDKDELGIGSDASVSYVYGSAYGYNMGNSSINILCEGTSYTGSGGYYYGVCADHNFRIETSLYLAAQNANRLANPAIVRWPYPGQEDSIPVFNEESPDPLPTCRVSGYPVSVQFNPAKSGTVAMTSFKLYNKNHNEITETMILSESTDVNNRFTDREFALFPLQRLDWSSRYSAEFQYTEDGTPKSLTWDFNTRDLRYPYYPTASGNSYSVVSGQTYAFYLPPSDCNDIISSYSYTYTPPAIVLQAGFVDSNTLYLQLDGSDNLSMTVTAYKAGGGSNIFTLVLAPKGTAILRGDTNGDGTTTLADGILSLQVVSGSQGNTLNLNGDADGNGKIGLEDALFVLQTLSGL